MKSIYRPGTVNDKSLSRCFQRGMTMIELTVVLLILIALAGVVIPYVGGTSRMAMCQATDATLHAVKEAIMGGAAGAGYYADTLGTYPANNGNTDYNLKYLFDKGNWPEYNPKTAVGWRGPYLHSGGAPIPSVLGESFTDENKVHVKIDATAGSQVLDAWGRPIILQVPDIESCNTLTGKTTKEGECARLVSAGPGWGLGSNEAELDTTIGARRDSDADDRILYLRIPEPKDDVNIPCDQS